MKSFVAKDGSDDPPSPGRNGERDFHGEQRCNETHAFTTNPEAKLYRKGRGKEVKRRKALSARSRPRPARMRVKPAGAADAQGTPHR
jgi:hypothetical protein